MKQKIATFFSFIFHPILLPTFATIVLFALPSHLSNFQFVYKKGIVQIVFLSTFVSPLLMFLILVNLRVISSIYLNKRKERYIPFLMVSLIYFATYFIINNLALGVLKVSPYIGNFILLSGIVIIITMFINLKIKSSIHMAGIGAFLSYFYVFFINENVGDILFYFYNITFLTVHFFSVIIIVVGIIATSRLILKAHNLLEIGVGFFIGLSLGFVSAFL